MAARPAGAVLLLGAADLGGGWYETRPAVIDTTGDLEPSGPPCWVGSRHLAVHAIRKGLFSPLHAWRRLAVYRLTAEGRSLARDLAETTSALSRRIRDLETELAEVLASIDMAIELDQPALPPDVLAGGTGRITGDISMQTALMMTLRDASGGWVSAEVLRRTLDVAANGSGPRQRLPNAVYQLRKRGWMIEHDPLSGYRLASAVRGDPDEAMALGLPSAPPVPPPDARRTCIHCGVEKWLGEFKWHKSYRRFLNGCRECHLARDRARRR